MRKALKAICVLMAIILILAIPTTASEDRSITLNYSPGVCSFRFYKIADLSSSGQLSLAAPFTDYTDSIDTLDRIGSLNTDNICDNTERLLMVSFFRCDNGSMVMFKKKRVLTF